MNLVIKCLKESLAESNLSKKTRQTLEKRLAELEGLAKLEKRQVKHSYTKKEKKFSIGQSITNKRFSIIHPVLGEIGDIIKTLVNKAASYHFRRLPKYIVVEFRDIWQAGMLGALESVSRYDISKDVSIQTFLFKRVNGGILDLLRSVDHIKRTQRTRIKEINKKQEKMTQELKNDISRVFVATGMSIEHQIALETASFVKISLEEPIRDIDNLLFIETIPSDAIDPCDFVVEIARREKLWKLIEKLPDKDRVVITMFSMGIILQDIGKVFGFTESWACLAKRRILKDLRLELKDY